jgi:DNA-binding transcriptional LysR family regulator
MTMDLRQLECFLAVARTLHFGRAAEELYLAQPTVSESIRRLEKELGGTLFDRTTRRVTLTPLGEMFAVEAAAAAEGLTTAYARGRAYALEQVTELRVGFSFDVTNPLVDVIAELQRRRPGVVVNLRGRSTTRQLKLLRERRLEAAFCVMPEPDPLLESLDVGVSRLVAVVRDSDPLAKEGAIPLAALAKEPLIAWPRAANPALYDRFASAMDATGESWTLVGTAAGAENVTARVLAGFGVGLLFDSARTAPGIAGVGYLDLVDGPCAERRMVWRADDRDPALRELVELTRERLPGPA